MNVPHKAANFMRLSDDSTGFSILRIASVYHFLYRIILKMYGCPNIYYASVFLLKVAFLGQIRHHAPSIFQYVFCAIGFCCLRLSEFRNNRTDSLVSHVHLDSDTFEFVKC